MSVAARSGYLIRKLADAPSVPCPCGVSTRPLTAADGAPCSLHVTEIRDSARHYHRETTEVYYILEGTGKIELNGDRHDLEPGTVIWIEPGTRHRVTSEMGLKTIVFALPAFNPDDEWFD
jgi:mannose-6-phosphate isomerase-like protein (cupin superfamily)